VVWIIAASGLSPIVFLITIRMVSVAEFLRVLLESDIPTTIYLFEICTTNWATMVNSCIVNTVL